MHWERPSTTTSTTIPLIMLARNHQRWNMANKVAQGIADDHKKTGVRLIFWNSIQSDNQRFKQGAHVCLIPYRDLKVIFDHVVTGVTGHSLTHPHLGIEAIPPQWLSTTSVLHIITDGDIGPRSIEMYQDLFKKAIDTVTMPVQIHTVVYSFNMNTEVSVEGNDMFQLLKDSDRVTKFDVFTPTDHSVLLERPSIATFGPNVVRYGNRGFDAKHMHAFVTRVLPGELKTVNPLELCQRLNTTIQDYVRITQRGTSLTSDHHNVRALVGAIANRFEGTAITPQMAFSLLFNSFGQVVSTLDLNKTKQQTYKQANEALVKDAATAIGLMSQGFVNIPLLNGTIGIGANPGALVKYNKFNNAAFDYDGRPWPLIPFTMDAKTCGQAIRQYTRDVLATEFPHLIHSVYGDFVMYLTMAFILKAPSKVRDVFKSLFRIMMEKKRKNSLITEYQYLLDGNPPTPNNGRHADMAVFMQKIQSYLNLPENISTQQVWGLLVNAVGDADLSAAQQLHMATLDTQPTIEEFNIIHVGYVYECPITLESTASTGGFVIEPHSNNSCRPCAVFKDTKNVTYCPYCFEPNITFSAIEPEVNSIYPVPVVPTKKSPPSNRNPIKHVIVLRGSVGAGKSTFAKKLTDHFGPKRVLVLNTDKWAVDHKQTGRQKILSVENEVRNNTTKDIMVVDTCNENNSNYNKIFRYKPDKKTVNIYEVFVNFNENIQDRDYIQWTLRNVLERKETTYGCGYWLNPINAPLATSLNVHQDKCTKVLNSYKRHPGRRAMVNGVYQVPKAPIKKGPKTKVTPVQYPSEYQFMDHATLLDTLATDDFIPTSLTTQFDTLIKMISCPY